MEILWDNIKESELTNFNKHSRAKINTFQVKYDYSSIMHYGPTASIIYIVILKSEATFCLLYIIIRNDMWTNGLENSQSLTSYAVQVTCTFCTLQVTFCYLQKVSPDLNINLFI